MRMCKWGDFPVAGHLLYRIDKDDGSIKGIISFCTKMVVYMPYLGEAPYDMYYVNS